MHTSWKWLRQFLFVFPTHSILCLVFSCSSVKNRLLLSIGPCFCLFLISFLFSFFRLRFYVCVFFLCSCSSSSFTFEEVIALYLNLLCIFCRHDMFLCRSNPFCPIDLAPSHSNVVLDISHFF